MFALLSGLWRGTQVAIKAIVLPANMSGHEKRERMVSLEFSTVTATACSMLLCLLCLHYVNTLPTVIFIWTDRWLVQDAADSTGQYYNIMSLLSHALLQIVADMCSCCAMTAGHHGSCHQQQPKPS